MSTYTGEIIEESLENREILKGLKVISTRLSIVTPEHATPWLKQWTLHTIEVSDEQAPGLAEQLSTALDRAHGGSWYADFKSDRHHYIIYRGRIFFIDRSQREQYLAATAYGISLDIPPLQVDFETLVVPSTSN